MNVFTLLAYVSGILLVCFGIRLLCQLYEHDAYMRHGDIYVKEVIMLRAESGHPRHYRLARSNESGLVKGDGSLFAGRDGCARVLLTEDEPISEWVLYEPHEEDLIYYGNFVSVWRKVNLLASICFLAAFSFH